MILFPLHLILHFAVPALFATAFFRKYWHKAYLLMVVAMIVDLDHLLAEPIFDPNRCSIGFHPLHQLEVLPIYFLLALLPKTRLLGFGLITHMALDSIDCQLTNGVWFV
ncbi:MAG: hypothetical protein CMQ41_15125 [Gammaproteobacteria bacterium]|nr:hypothetical protein [Gammaproteobacteria bacterium]